MFLAVIPEYRRSGIGTALHHELKAHIPREVAFVGVYALLDSPVIPSSKRSGIYPASSICGWTATPNPVWGGGNPLSPLTSRTDRTN